MLNNKFQYYFMAVLIALLLLNLYAIDAGWWR